MRNLDIENSIKILIFVGILIFIGFSTDVKALVPVTYTCCVNYTGYNGDLIDGFEYVPMGGMQVENFDITSLGGSQIDGFENLSNWTLVSGNQTADTVNFKEAQQGMKLSTVSGADARTDLPVNYNFSNVNNFGIWVYVPDPTKLGGFSIYFASDGGMFNNYYQYWLAGSSFTPGWNKLIMDKNSPIFYNHNGNWSNINRVRIGIGATAGNNANVTLDDFRYNVNNDWGPTGTGCSQEYDSVNNGLKLIAIGGNRCATTKTVNYNLINTSTFGIWLYVDNASSYNTFQMFLTSDGGQFNKYFEFTNWLGLKNGWNKLVFDKSEFTNNNGEDWNNTMNKVMFGVFPNANQNTNVTLSDFRFNSNDDWLPGARGYVNNDSVNFKEGSQGLNMTTYDNLYGFTLDKTINKDFSNTNNIVFWVYIDDATNLSFLRVTLTSSPADWNTLFYDYFYQMDSFKSGWNKLVINKHDFKNAGGESWNNVMRRIRLNIGSMNNSIPTSATVDELRSNMSGQKAKLMIEFDDGEESVYTKAYPILSSNKQNATAFIVPNWLDDIPNESMNVTQLHNLQGVGWDISSHTMNHPDGNPPGTSLRTLNDSQLSYELNASYNFLVSNGFQKTAGFLAYPYGSFDDRVINFVKNRYIFGRATVSAAAQQHFTSDDDGERYIQRVISVQNVTTPQNIMDNLSDTINAKLLGIVLFHGIADSNPTNDPTIYNTNDFQQFSGYIKNSAIDIVTESDYVIPNINNFTPVINKITRIYSNGSSVMLTKNKFDEYMPNMTVKPSSGSIDINITTYDETNGIVKFNETASNSSIQVSYNIGDRLPNHQYNVTIYWTNGTKYQSLYTYADSTGFIHYNSTGFQRARYQYISPYTVIFGFTVTLPSGYTNLRFNSTGSTITNLSPDGQNDSQPFFNITNTGNINENFVFYFGNAAIANITTYADLSNNLSSGRIQINSSKSTVVIPDLIPNASQNVWMAIDAYQAPPTNMNAALTIGLPIPGFVSDSCDPSLWNYVWGENQNHTSRLLLNNTYPCIDVTGTIDGISAEDDGDYSIGLTVDPQYNFLLNQQNNIQIGQGDMLIEVVCGNSNSTNQPVCNNFNQSYLLNNVSIGAHVEVIGQYVTDVGGLTYGWNEIHPITSINAIPVIVPFVMPANRSKPFNMTGID